MSDLPERQQDAAAVPESAHIEIPPLRGPILRRSIWRQWRNNSLLFCFVSVYLELSLHLCVFGGINSRIVFPVLFGCVAGFVLSAICAGLPRIPGRSLTVAMIAVQVIYAEVQLVYHAIFGNFMPISLVGLGEGVVTNFTGNILYGISQNIPQILLLLLPLILVSVLLALRKAPRHRVTWKQTAASLGGAALILALSMGIMYMGRGETFSVWEIFNNVNTSTDTSYKNVGMFATTGQELRYMITGIQEEGLDLSALGIGTSERGKTYSQREYNVMDIDFEALAESTDDETLKAMDEYFATLTPTRKNDYTGLLEGYNLITICAESYCPYFLSEELTPTLYKLANNGIVFENYYGTFQSVTTNGEYTMNMGLFPDLSRTKTQSSFDLSSGNYLPFCLGNALKGEGYQTWAYHNYIGDFYNRNITHANMGYTFQGAEDLGITVDWPSSDLDMMVASVDDYIDTGAPFHAYYMTFSGHYQYNWENAMSKKNQEAVMDLDYSQGAKAYIACNLELEYALSYLLERLEEAGIADKTVIVLTNDHYPYGLTEEEYNELAGQTLDTTFEKYRNHFICYVPGLRENIYVEDYCSTQDILPTLLNLFGVEYDSRLLTGTDVLSGSTHVAILSDKSFITEDFRYDANLDEVTVHTEGLTVSDETLENFRVYVNNKFVLSTDILNTNYYAHVFGETQSESSGMEETVVFTDISNIFNQASVLYMYRNGYVDPVGEDTFGGRQVSEVGEFVDVLYRIAERPETTAEALPEDAFRGEFDETHPYYSAMCWAWETGLLREEDKRTGYDSDVDYRTAALLIYRYAQNIGLDVSQDEMWVLDMMEAYPRLEEEWVRAFMYLESADITSKDYELEELMEKATSRISRYQMTSFLFYFCSYELGLDG